MPLTPADVASGQPIASVAWGNPVRDRTLQVFSSVADRDGSWGSPPVGAHCITTDTYTVWVRHVSGSWIPLAQEGRPIGTISLPTDTTTTDLNGQLVGATLSFAIAGASRTVGIIVSVRHDRNGAGLNKTQVQIDGVTVPGGVITRHEGAGGNYQQALSGHGFKDLAAGSHSARLLISTPAGGSATMMSGTNFTLVDAGLAAGLF